MGFVFDKRRPSLFKVKLKGSEVSGSRFRVGDLKPRMPKTLKTGATQSSVLSFIAGFMQEDHLGTNLPSQKLPAI